MIKDAANLLSSPEYLLSLPIVLLVLFAAGIFLIDLVTPPEWKWMNAATAMAGVLFSAAGVMRIQSIQEQLESSGRRLQWAFGHSVLIDHLSIYFYYLFLIIAAITILTSVRHVQVPGVEQGKVYALILLSVAGMMCMAAGFDIVIIFVGLELMGLSTYILVAHLGKDLRDREAGLNYFLRSAFSSAVFASGLCLLYGLTGSTNLQLISQGLKNTSHAHSILGGHAVAILAVALTAVGLLFKIAAMPFHRWILDLCDGAPGSIAGFICLAFQVAGWAMLLRILLWGLYPLRAKYVPMLIIIAVISMLGANIAALTQTGAARLFAYSSIAQVGFIVLGLVSLASVRYPDPAFFEGFKGILFHLLAYTLMNLGGFAIVGALQGASLAGNRGKDDIGNLAGLFYRDPVLASFMAIFLLSLAGVPLFAGFYGKYFILHSLFASEHYVVAALAILCSIIGLYYYGRLAQVMFVCDQKLMGVSTGVSLTVALGILGFFTAAIGIYPKPFIRAVEWSLRLT